MVKPLLLLMLMGVGLLGCEQQVAENKPAKDIVRPAKLYTVGAADSGSIRKFPATTLANQSVDMSFRIPGQLDTLDLVEGQEVSKGDLLARLDQRDAKSRLQDAQANHELALANYDRTTKLLQRKLVSKSDYDLVKAQLKTAEAALENAKNSLDYTELRAPFDGLIGRLSVKNFQYIQPQQPILLLLGTKKIDVRIQVPEELYLNARRDPLPDDFSPELRFPANPTRKFNVRFKEFASEIDPSTQSYAVTFTLDAPDDIWVVPGMAAELYIDLDIITGKNTNQFVIPETALMTRDGDGKAVVWRYDADSGQIKTVEVVLGKMRSSGVEVISGLRAGDQVVVAGLDSLTEGMAVKPLSWERGI